MKPKEFSLRDICARSLPGTPIMLPTLRKAFSDGAIQEVYRTAKREVISLIGRFAADFYLHPPKI